jgi:hypothetical protein
MNKSELFPVLDKQAKQLRHIQSIANVLVVAGGVAELPKDCVNDCISLMGDLASDARQSHALIANSLPALSMDDGA